MVKLEDACSIKPFAMLPLATHFGDMLYISHVTDSRVPVEEKECTTNEKSLPFFLRIVLINI